MVYNPITEEIREIRHRLAAEFNNDIAQIGAETRRRQQLSGHRVVQLVRRIPATYRQPIQPLSHSGETIVSEVISNTLPPSER